MLIGNRLQFQCQECEAPVTFSVLTQEVCKKIECPECGQKYQFDDSTILRHLQQFEALCKQIHASQEILGSTSISIDVGSHHVNVPFNILLTRLSSVIELNFNGKKIKISFRVEPLKDIPSIETMQI